MKTLNFCIPGSQDKCPFELAVNADVSLHRMSRHVLESVVTFTNHFGSSQVLAVIPSVSSSKTSKTPLRIYISKGCGYENGISV